MKKLKFALVELGNVHSVSDLRILKSWKSDLFEINNVFNIQNLPSSKYNDGYLDVKYNMKELAEHVTCPSDSDIAVGVMPYRFVDNFYMHRVSSNVALISLYGIKEILNEENISIDHFIIKQLYELTAIRNIMHDISSEAVYDFVHADTRGCLFDLNGDRTNILYNTESPIICDACKAYLNRCQISKKVIETLERELKRIKKPLIVRLERTIKKYPYVSLMCSFIATIIVSLLADILFALLTNICE